MARHFPLRALLGAYLICSLIYPFPLSAQEPAAASDGAEDSGRDAASRVAAAAPARAG
jgi:hypothetical protein